MRYFSAEELTEIAEAARELARLSRIWFDAFAEQGFTAEQSLALTKEPLRLMLRNVADSGEDA